MQTRPTRFTATRTLERVPDVVPLANNVIRFDSVVEPFSMKVIRSDVCPETLSVRYMNVPSLLLRSAINTGWTGKNQMFGRPEGDEYRTSFSIF